MKSYLVKTEHGFEIIRSDNKKSLNKDAIEIKDDVYAGEELFIDKKGKVDKKALKKYRDDLKKSDNIDLENNKISKPLTQKEIDKLRKLIK